MKRVYRKSRYSKGPGAVIRDLFTSLSLNRSRCLVGVVVFLAVLFLVSSLLVLANSYLWPPLKRATALVETPDGISPDPPGVSAAAAVLMDQESGKVLYEKKAHEKLPIASTTKMMTALVIREQLELDDEITVSESAASIGEQEIWLSAGEVLTVEELLWALMVHSANDAACALAEYTTGGVESFARLMNKKAKEIGAVDSNFKNPHGLDEPDHFSSAYDLALIGRELMNDPLLAEMASSKQYDLRWPGHPSPRTCISHNEILYSYQGATGIKTGYTLGAGRCLVASAKRDSKSLVAVALNSEFRDSDVAGLFDYGFDATTRIVLAGDGQDLGSTRVSAYPRRYVTAVPEKELAVLSITGSGDSFSVETDIESRAGSPVEEGDTLGTVICSEEGRKLYEENAVAASSASPSGTVACVFWFLWYVLCWMGKIIAMPVLIWL